MTDCIKDTNLSLGREVPQAQNSSQNITWQDGCDDGADDWQVDDDSNGVDLAQLVDVDEALDRNDGNQVEQGEHHKGAPDRHEARSALPRAPPVQADMQPYQPLKCHTPVTIRKKDSSRSDFLHLEGMCSALRRCNSAV